MSQLNIKTLAAADKNRQQVPHEASKKLLERKVKVSKQPAREENNSNIDYSEVKELIWDYQTQQLELPSSVLEKVGKSFVDR